jgi:ubiquinone/menaquinone biosynthesis C-methylase UbiE
VKALIVVGGKTSMVNADKFKADVRRHFDERAEQYDHDTETLDRQDFDNFATVVPYMIEYGGKRMLEVGVGTGIVLERLLAAGKDGYGLDLSPGLLQVAVTKRGIPQERLICGDAEYMPYTDGEFDTVGVLRSLHHMPDPGRVLKEMTRCARQGVFVYDSVGGRSRLVKQALRKVGLYQPLFVLLRGQRDTGYRPASETEGPIHIFYAEDAIPILQQAGLRIVARMHLGTSLFIHAVKRRDGDAIDVPLSHMSDGTSRNG